MNIRWLMEEFQKYWITKSFQICQSKELLNLFLKCRPPRIQIWNKSYQIHQVLIHKSKSNLKVPLCYLQDLTLNLLRKLVVGQEVTTISVLPGCVEHQGFQCARTLVKSSAGMEFIWHKQHIRSWLDGSFMTSCPSFSALFNFILKN